MRKRRGPAKLVGELAEIRFFAKATELGFTVSRPFGDCSPYDFIVEKGGRVRRVQVKSAGAYNCHRYQVHTVRSDGSRYTRRQIDFIAAYVFPYDTWYLIPIKWASRRVGIPLYPHKKKSRGQWARFREAWHLL
jgi:cbb3-type cytochrome oxidase cytochrome c subunit